MDFIGCGTARVFFDAPGITVVAAAALSVPGMGCVFCVLRVCVRVWCVIWFLCSFFVARIWASRVYTELILFRFPQQLKRTLSTCCVR